MEAARLSLEAYRVYQENLNSLESAIDGFVEHAKASSCPGRIRAALSDGARFIGLGRLGEWLSRPSEAISKRNCTDLSKLLQEHAQGLPVSKRNEWMVRFEDHERLRAKIASIGDPIALWQFSVNVVVDESIYTDSHFSRINHLIGTTLDMRPASTGMFATVRSLVTGLLDGIGWNSLAGWLSKRSLNQEQLAHFAKHLSLRTGGKIPQTLAQYNTLLERIEESMGSSAAKLFRNAVRVI